MLMDRRTFLRAGSTAVAATALAPSVLDLWRRSSVGEWLDRRAEEDPGNGSVLAEP